MKLNFCPAQPEDIPALMDIYNYYVQHSVATFQLQPLTRAEFESTIFFSKPKHCTYTVWADTIPCGYISLHTFKIKEAYDRTAEVTLYLHPDYIGRGIGTQALRFIEDYARTTDIKVLISCITGTNQPSLRLFEKEGFTRCAHYREVGCKFDQILDVIDLQKIL